eukprot:scaffold9816_cov99-Skeletonema_dohrnii-CCMP3373.AAC.16
MYYCLSAALNETARQVGKADKRYNDEKNAVSRKRNADFTSTNSAAGDHENNSAHYTTFGSMGCWSCCVVADALCWSVVVGWSEEAFHSEFL